MSYFCSCSSNFRITVRAILPTGFNSHQSRSCYFDVFPKLAYLSVSFWATAKLRQVHTNIVRAENIVRRTGENIGTVSLNFMAVCKQEKVVRLLRVDLTHKIKIIFHFNCHVQLLLISKEILKTSGRRQWFTETLTSLPGKYFQGVLLLVSWDCSFYGKGPQDNQHQKQTKLRFHSFLYYKKNKTLSGLCFRSDTGKPNPENIMQRLYKNTETLFDEPQFDFSLEFVEIGS